LTRTPWQLRRLPPRLGEHDAEVDGDPFWQGEARQGNPMQGSRSGRDRATRPLDGLRVLDFTWVVAGPVATRILADQGARVIKIERRGAADFGTRRGGLTGNLNRGKESIVLDLSRPRGLELARRLAAQCDVVIDNFSARVMEQWGLDYPELSRLRPDVIAVRLSGFGLSGPRRDEVSYGPTLQALAGFPFLMRLAGEAPAGWGYSWSDMAAGMMGAFATLAALRHRDQTGEGQLVDLAQLETLVSLLGPQVVDLLQGDRVAPPGNASQEGPAAPHGVYRCSASRRADGSFDDDRWLAIAVLSDEQWQRLAEELGRDGESWALERSLQCLEERLERSAEIDRRLSLWTRTRVAEDIEERLQAAGVPAGLVANGEDMAHDPQLAARGYFETVRGPDGALETFDGVPFLSSNLPGGVARPGPLLGEHGDVVLTGLLGLSREEIEGLRLEGVVG
jgi:crotonobetainyl-CoA:carnitine CoA-transferase CaiB-like acyl-CoA transferase